MRPSQASKTPNHTYDTPSHAKHHVATSPSESLPFHPAWPDRRHLWNERPEHARNRVPVGLSHCLGTDAHWFCSYAVDAMAQSLACRGEYVTSKTKDRPRCTHRRRSRSADRLGWSGGGTQPLTADRPPERPVSPELPKAGIWPGPAQARRSRIEDTSATSPHVSSTRPSPKQPKSSRPGVIHRARTSLTRPGERQVQVQGRAC